MEYGTPKFREMTNKEASDLKLVNGENHYTHSGVPVGAFLEPVWQSVSEVWMTATNKNTITYRMYDLGTNHLKVTRYVPKADKWEEIKVEDIQGLYGLMWRIMAHMTHIKSKLKSKDK
jgi:hypothetical protein